MALVRQTRNGNLVSNVFTPVKGFVTEFTPTQFPIDAAIDIDNCIIDVDGSVRRRPGLNYEFNYTLNQVNGGVIDAAELETISRNVGLWTNVANSGTLNIVLVQIGTVLQFYAQIGALSQNLLGEIDLSPYATEAALLRTSRVQGASALGNLYLVGKHLNPLCISYDGVDFTVRQQDIKIRDFDGVEDNLAVDQRPTSLKISHYYNLKNQGWSSVNILNFADVADGANIGDTEEAAHEWICERVAEGELIGNESFPSNADIMYLGFTTDNDGNPTFEREQITDAHYLGNTPAPKGHYLLNPFFQNRDDALGCAGVGSTLFSTRPEAVAFHNGRVFYSKQNTQNTPSGIYFSQTLTKESNADNWHAEADPTADEINDIVATDGGFIPTPSVGRVYTLVELSNGVLICASNGVWYLTGAGDGEGFTATSSRIVKVTDAGLIGENAYVEAEDGGYFWSQDGIMAVTINDFGMPQALNISEKTIQQFYINISATSRANARGIYVPEQRKVYWGYLSATASESTSSLEMDSILIFDLTIGGFYKYSIQAAEGFPKFMGFSRVESLGENTGLEAVTTRLGEVVTLLDGTTPVEVDQLATVAQVTQLKILTAVNSTVNGGWVVTFGEFNDRTFHDWRFGDLTGGVGLNYSSYVEFGYNTFGQNYTKGMPVYVHTFHSLSSKNLNPGGYYELPPKFSITEGLNISQSVLEVLVKGDSDLRSSQTILEVLTKADPALRASQSVMEVLVEVP